MFTRQCFQVHNQHSRHSCNDILVYASNSGLFQKEVWLSPQFVIVILQIWIPKKFHMICTLSMVIFHSQHIYSQICASIATQSCLSMSVSSHISGALFFKHKQKMNTQCAYYVNSQNLLHKNAAKSYELMFVHESMRPAALYYTKLCTQVNRASYIKSYICMYTKSMELAA